MFPRPMPCFAAALLAVALTTVGCTNTTDRIVESEHCIEWQDDIVLLPVTMSCGNNCTTTMMQVTPVSTCSAAIVLAEPNPNYKGPTP